METTVGSTSVLGYVDSLFEGQVTLAISSVSIFRQAQIPVADVHPDNSHSLTVTSKNFPLINLQVGLAGRWVQNVDPPRAGMKFIHSTMSNGFA